MVRTPKPNSTGARIQAILTEQPAQTLGEVASQVGVSKERVRQIVRIFSLTRIRPLRKKQGPRVPRVTRPCRYCGEPVTRTESAMSKRRDVYCSEAHRRELFPLHGFTSENYYERNRQYERPKVSPRLTLDQLSPGSHLHLPPHPADHGPAGQVCRWTTAAARVNKEYAGKGKGVRLLLLHDRTAGAAIAACIQCDEACSSHDVTGTGG